MLQLTRPGRLAGPGRAALSAPLTSRQGRCSRSSAVRASKKTVRRWRTDTLSGEIRAPGVGGHRGECPSVTSGAWVLRYSPGAGSSPGPCPLRAKEGDTGGGQMGGQQLCCRSWMRQDRRGQTDNTAVVFSDRHVRGCRPPTRRLSMTLRVTQILTRG